ncbi:MFS transporter [Chloroflexota bacterium]
MKRRRFPRIFFGWWTVVTSGTLALWVAGYHIYGFSALFKPMASELGFNRTVMSGAASIGRFEGGFEAPLAGWITDRFGPRWILFFGAFLFGLGLILMNFTNSLWAYYVVWGVLVGTGANIIMGVPFNTAITNWFVKKRGLALSVRFVLAGLGGTVVLPMVVARLIITQGWRMTCVVGGLVMWLVGLPLTWFFLKRYRPEYYGLLPDGAAVEGKAADGSQIIDRGVKYADEVQEVEFTLRQAMRTPAYWLLMVAHATHSLVQPAISIHGIPFLTDVGIDPLKAAGMMAMMVLSGIPSRILVGLLADRVKKQNLRFLMGVTYLLPAVGIALFLLNQTMVMIYVWFILHGMGWGASALLSSILRARYFGRKAFGSIHGTSMMFVTPLGVAAPIYLGWVYDTTGSYITAFTLIAALLAFATVLIFFILPPKPPAKITDIREIV